MAGGLISSKAQIGGKLGAEGAVGKDERLKSQQLRSCLLILGMHESGGPLLTGTLARLGIGLPASAGVQSEGGRSAKILDFNEELLQSIGSSWDDFTPFPEEWLQSPVASGFVNRAHQLLKEEFSNTPVFVLDDPAISRIVPVWRAAFKQFGCAVKPILMVRNPLEVGADVHRARGLNEAFGQILWLRYALDAERFTRGMPRLHVSFEQLLQNWAAIAAGAEEELQLVWPKPIRNVEIEVERFLENCAPVRTDSHVRSLTSPLLPDWVKEAYRLLNGWALGDEMGAHQPLLDKVRSEFDAASYAFARVVRGERQTSAQREAEALERASREMLEAEIVRIEAEALDVSSRLETTKRELQDQRRKATLMNAELHALKEGREDLETQLLEARSNVAASRERRKEMARVIARRDADLQARYQELALLQRHLMRYSLSWRIKRLYGWIKRQMRRNFGQVH